jgi:Ca2+-binding RTX toxin-like protein
MIGNLADNTFWGGKGADRLNGGQGRDVLVGGPGKDVLRGGDGADVFVFDKMPNSSSNVDKIADLNVKEDYVYLDNAVFKALGKGSPAKPHKLPKGFFTIGDKAKDANDFVVYDPKKGLLFYDTDGSGAGEAVRITTLSKSLKISVADLFVI